MGETAHPAPGSVYEELLDCLQLDLFGESSEENHGRSQIQGPLTSGDQFGRFTALAARGRRLVGKIGKHFGVEYDESEVKEM